MERGVFGDSHLGASARRDHLLRERREQLGVMPLEVRRIYVRRIARMVVGMTAAAGALLLYLEGNSFAVRGAVESLLPGLPAVLTTTLLVVVIAVALSYFVARTFAEDYFTRAMMIAVGTSFDLHGDVQRLANVHPHDAARSMARRAELWSTAWAAWGAVLLAPFIITYLVEASTAGGFPPGTLLEAKLIDVTELPLLGAALATAVIWSICRHAARTQSSPSPIGLLLLWFPPVLGAFRLLPDHWAGGIAFHFIVLAPVLYWFRSRAVKERRALG